MANPGGVAGLWNARGPGGRAALLAGVVMIALCLVAGLIWSMQPDYRILFSNLSEPDAAAIVSAPRFLIA